MKDDIPRLVLDANILVSALMGKSFPLLLGLFEIEVTLLAPIHQIAETRKILREKSSFTDLEVDELMTNLLDIIIPLHPVLFQKHEEKARARLHVQGQADWPVLAASMEIGAAIWSHDKDFFGSGAAVWSTKILRKQLEMAAQ